MSTASIVHVLLGLVAVIIGSVILALRKGRPSAPYARMALHWMPADEPDGDHRPKLLPPDSLSWICSGRRGRTDGSNPGVQVSQPPSCLEVMARGVDVVFDARRGGSDRWRRRRRGSRRRKGTGLLPNVQRGDCLRYRGWLMDHRYTPNRLGSVGCAGTAGSVSGLAGLSSRFP